MQVKELLTMLDAGNIRVRLVHGMFPECGGVVGTSPDEPGIFYIWLNADDSEGEILSSFKHELWHIGRGDFESNVSVQVIESIAHRAQEHDFYGIFDRYDLVPYLRGAKVITYDRKEIS